MCMYMYIAGINAAKKELKKVSIFFRWYNKFYMKEVVNQSKPLNRVRALLCFCSD